MATEAEHKIKDSELRPEVFDDYDAFLKQAIRDYYDRGWKSRRGNFIALVIASCQMASLAADSIRDGSGLKRAAIGAAGVVALRVGLRYALSGPLGIIGAPRSDGCWAAALPGPLLLPVTSAVLPAKPCIMD